MFNFFQKYKNNPSKIEDKILNLCKIIALTIALITTGFFLILMGFLVKKNPQLLAGYNTMSPTEKKDIDIDKVSTIARNSLIITGAAVVDFTLITAFFNTNGNTRVLGSTLIIVVGVIVMIVIANNVPKLKG